MLVAHHELSALPGWCWVLLVPRSTLLEEYREAAHRAPVSRWPECLLVQYYRRLRVAGIFLCQPVAAVMPIARTGLHATHQSTRVHPHLLGTRLRKAARQAHQTNDQPERRDRELQLSA